MNLKQQAEFQALKAEVAELKALLREIQARLSKPTRNPNGTSRTKGTVPTGNH
jgi:hypothetical protein